MTPDPGIQPIRDVRKAISRRLGNDPSRLVAYYAEMEKRFKGRLCHGPSQTEPEDGRRGAEQGDEVDPPPR